MIEYEFNAEDIKGNIFEIPKNIISKIPKTGKFTLTFKEYDENAEDEYLLALAEERLKSNKPTISHEEMWHRLGITEEDLENVEADEFE